MRFAAEHPDNYDSLLDAMASAADDERKRRRELGLCAYCGRKLSLNREGCTHTDEQGK